MNPLLTQYDLILWGVGIGLFLGAAVGAFALALLTGARREHHNNQYKGGS